MDKQKIISILEGLLFITGDNGISLEEASTVLDNNDKNEIANIIEEMSRTYEQDPKSGLVITKFAGDKYRMSTKKVNHEWYLKLVNLKTEAKLSSASIEVLAIIAYKQPITRPKIEQIRGVNCETILYKLKLRNLIQELGKSDEPGKPVLYGVTDDFMKLFGLNSLDELPRIDADQEDTPKDLFS